MTGCTAPSGYAGNDDDCDDTDPGIHGPGTWYIDGDGDGWGGEAVTACEQPPFTVATGGDCYDASADIYPGAPEDCNGIDEDCDGIADNGVEIDFYPDSDGDGYGDATGTPVTGCTAPSGYAGNNDDCNDSNSNIHPAMTEVCNLLDDNCNGTTDEGFATQTYYQDNDNDGRGNPAVSVEACMQPLGYVTTSNDCDDNSATACPKPTALSTTNITNVTATVNWSYLPCAYQYRLEYRRRSGPSPIESSWNVVYTSNPTYVLTNLMPGGILYQWRVATICTPGVTSAQSGYATPIQQFYTRYLVYADTDGDGFGDLQSPLFVASIPQSGFVSNNTDCNDNAASIYPGALETCNGLDDDCDLIADEGVNWYQDSDGDGLGNPGVIQNYCEQPVGYVANQIDCDDNNNLALCSVPTGVNAGSIGTTTATISWTGVPCATGYTLMYRVQGTSNFSPQIHTANHSVLLTGLAPGTTYQLRIRSKCPAPNPATTSSWLYILFTTQAAPLGLMSDVSMDAQSSLEPVQMDIYPNPGNGLFNLRMTSEVEDDVDIIVTDAIGKAVFSAKRTLYEGMTIDQLDLTSLANGVYQIHVQKGEWMMTRKLIIAH